MSENPKYETTALQTDAKDVSVSQTEQTEVKEQPKESLLGRMLLANKKIRRGTWYVLAVLATLFCLVSGAYASCIMFVIAIIFTLPTVERKFSQRTWIPWLVRVVCALIGAGLLTNG